MALMARVGGLAMLQTGGDSYRLSRKRKYLEKSVSSSESEMEMADRQVKTA